MYASHSPPGGFPKDDFCNQCRKRTEQAKTKPKNFGRSQKEAAPKGKLWCHTCMQYRRQNEFVKSARSKCKPCQRRYRVQSRYGITWEEYEAIKEVQGGKCYLCQRATGKSRALSVDHDHSLEVDGKVTRQSIRGLLCDTCNRTIGHFRDDSTAFKRAANYLHDPPAQWVLSGSAKPPNTQNGDNR